MKALAGGTPFEFQRLHGMGEGLYEELAKLERGIGDEPTPVRIYAPVGSHKELLAYLVRRLLENGANSSFVNRIADDDIPVDDLVRDPVAELEKLEPKRNPAIPLPNAIFGKGRINSAGVDLSDPLVREPLMKKLKTARSQALDRDADRRRQGRKSADCRRRTTPRWSSARRPGRAKRTSTAWSAPPMPRRSIGTSWAAKRARACSTAPPTCSSSIARSCSRCACARPGRPCPTRCSKCARRSISCAITPARRGACFTRPTPLPGPTGELNELRLHGRGVFACISPWNFPLAIFIGPVAAALAAGNAAIAKPAEQTPLIGALAVELMHMAGIPKAIVQLLPGDGKVGSRADLAPADRRRRLHRLDRHRPRDQPQPCRAATGRSSR